MNSKLDRARIQRLTTEQISDAGARAFREGLTLNADPFKYHAVKTGGPGRSACWVAGWVKASKEVRK